MGVVHVENVDEKIMNSIRIKAEANGRSFEEEVRAILDQHTRLVKDRLAEAAAIRAMTKGWTPETDSVRVIREIRDRDH